MPCRPVGVRFIAAVVAGVVVGAVVEADRHQSPVDRCCVDACLEADLGRHHLGHLGAGSGVHRWRLAVADLGTGRLVRLDRGGAVGDRPECGRGRWCLDAGGASLAADPGSRRPDHFVADLGIARSDRLDRVVAADGHFAPGPRRLCHPVRDPCCWCRGAGDASMAAGADDLPAPDLCRSCPDDGVASTAAGVGVRRWGLVAVGLAGCRHCRFANHLVGAGVAAAVVRRLVWHRRRARRA